MGLYPVITVPAEQVGGMLAIPPGSLLVIPLMIPASGGVILQMAQIAPTQDFSIRGWVSQEPNGASVGLGHYNANWCLSRTPETLGIYDRALTPPPATMRLAAVPPGAAVMNLLNLVNAENVMTATLANLLSILTVP